MYEETGQAVTTMRLFDHFLHLIMTIFKTDFSLFPRRVDGGVCRNDFLMQLIADLTQVTIERPVSIETASHGAAMMAGIQAGTEHSLRILILIKLLLLFLYVHRNLEVA